MITNTLVAASAAIRERLAPSEAPDGPPLTPAQARRYFLQLADGKERARPLQRPSSTDG